jgi:hypothetical protein
VRSRVLHFLVALIVTALTDGGTRYLFVRGVPSADDFPESPIELHSHSYEQRSHTSPSIFDRLCS